MSFSIMEAAPLEFYTSHRGKEGWPVVAHQDALNSHYTTPPLTLDGVFGVGTEQVAKQVQLASHVTVDGILGPESQEGFVRAKCKHGEKGTTPPGLIIGICNIESSYQWACVSPLNPNGTHDYGPTQWSLAKATEHELLAAFNPDTSAHVLAGETQGYYRSFIRNVPNRRAWELAALAHNWPSAAFALASGKDEWLSKPEAWLTAKGYANGLDYTAHYIAIATAQVTSWSVV